MINTQLKDQLEIAISSGKFKPVYFNGYKIWKEKFDYFFNITKDVNQTLDILYGPNGGIDDYKGSIYRNSNLQIDKITKKKHIKEKIENKPSSVFSFLDIK